MHACAHTHPQIVHFILHAPLQLVKALLVILPKGMAPALEQRVSHTNSPICAHLERVFGIAVHDYAHMRPPHEALRPELSRACAASASL